MSLLYILAPFASLRDQDLRSYGHLKFFEKVKKNPKSSLRLISLSGSQIRNLRENSWWFKKKIHLKRKSTSHFMLSNFMVFLMAQTRTISITRADIQKKRQENNRRIVKILLEPMYPSHVLTFRRNNRRTTEELSKYYSNQCIHHTC